MIRQQIEEILAQYTGEPALFETDGLKSAGLDSIDLMEFFAELERTFGFHFKEGDLDMAKLDSLDEVTRLVEERLSQR